LRLFKTMRGRPRTFKYIICSGILINEAAESREMMNVDRTKVPFALFLKHPASILELDCISED
jgi:hypothetical protein